MTTIHANDTVSAIGSLQAMGVEPFHISRVLIGVLAQRLVRRVCRTCCISYQPNHEELGKFGLSTAQDLGLTFYKAKTLTPEQIQSAKAKGNICPECMGAGYKGRIGVYEVMQVNQQLQTLIKERAPTERIKAVAMQDGMKSLLSYSLDLVRQGYTTLEALEQVIFKDYNLQAELKAKRHISWECRTCHAQLKSEWLGCPFCMTPRFAD